MSMDLFRLNRLTALILTSLNFFNINSTILFIGSSFFDMKLIIPLSGPTLLSLYTTSLKLIIMSSEPLNLINQTISFSCFFHIIYYRVNYILKKTGSNLFSISSNVFHVAFTNLDIKKHHKHHGKCHSI
jgi:hypothetical protein